MRTRRGGRPRSETRIQKDAIYTALKNRIVFDELKVGDVLNETRLAADFGASRTLLREVIRRLLWEGFLAPSHSGGVQVRGIDVIQFKNLYEIRVPMEELAGRLAAERIRSEELAALRSIAEEGRAAFVARDFRTLVRLDWQFHTIIGQATRNENLAEFLLKLLAPVNRLWYLALSDFNCAADAVPDWLNVIRGLESRSAEDTSAALLVHMSRAPSQLLPLLSGAETLASIADLRLSRPAANDRLVPVP
jgi:DNA-binding GntR family transcriptional regulator